MIQDFWLVASFGPVLCIGTAITVAEARRRASRRAMQATSAQSDQSRQAREYLAPSIESAERQLGILLRRMRSYMRAPYAFEESRIRDAADFERCLDLATALCLRREELSGGSAPSPLQRERVRDQVLLSVSATSAPPIATRCQGHAYPESVTLAALLAL